MYVAHLSLLDFRSYPSLEVDFDPGVVALVGPNGQGKTNAVEAIGYLAALTSHRVGSNAPLIRMGADRAGIGVTARHGERTIKVALEIGSGRPAPPSVNGVKQTRHRDAAGIVRSVVFGPDDLSLVKGDPGFRRRFMDLLLVQRNPRWAGELGDYERVAKQRASLLKSLGSLRRAGRRAEDSTMEVWDDRLAGLGARIGVARSELVEQLTPHFTAAYQDIAGAGPAPGLKYVASGEPEGEGDSDAAKRRTVEEEKARLLDVIVGVKDREIERGVNLVGPHRDELEIRLGPMPAKGYASHGESWSLALALRLAAFEILADGSGGTPVLILDDVFAELDAARRDALVKMVRRAEQTVITAAVPADLPSALAPAIYRVQGGTVSRD